MTSATMRANIQHVPTEVILAGKGHETSIIGAAGTRPWDEAAAARRALAAMGWAAPEPTDRA